MMQRIGDRVIIDISSDDFNRLLLALGYASGAASRDDNQGMMQSFIKLANAINEGNPNWTPYEEGVRT